MESKATKSTLEPALVSILNGTDQSKLIPLFEKYSVTLDMFFSFADEDLLAIGVESLDERKRILNFKNNVCNSNQVDEDSTIGPEEILEIVRNSKRQIHAIDTATYFAISNLKKEKVRDFIVDGEKPITSAILMLSNRVEKESREFISDIDEVLKNLESIEEQKVGISRKNIWYGFTCGVVVMLVSVFVFWKFKKN